MNLQKKFQLKTFIVLVAKIDNINDDFLDCLQENLISKWNEIH